MKAWFHDPRSESGLVLKTAPTPDPGPGEILVRVRAAALNRGEFLVNRNLNVDQKPKAAGSNF